MASQTDDTFKIQIERLRHLTPSPLPLAKSQEVDRLLNEYFARAIHFFINENQRKKGLNLIASFAFLKYLIKPYREEIENGIQSQLKILKTLGDSKLEKEIQANRNDNEGLFRIKVLINQKRAKIIEDDPYLQKKENAQEFDKLENLTKHCTSLIDYNETILLTEHNLLETLHSHLNKKDINSILTTLEELNKEENNIAIKQNFMNHIQLLIDEENLKKPGKYGEADRSNRPEVWALKGLLDEIKKDYFNLMIDTMIKTMIPDNPEVSSQILSFNFAQKQDFYHHLTEQLKVSKDYPTFNEQDFEYCFNAATNKAKNVSICIRVAEKILNTNFSSPSSIQELDDFLMNGIGPLAAINQQSANNLIAEMVDLTRYYPGLYTKLNLQRINEIILERALNIEKNQRIGTAIDHFQSDLKDKFEQIPKDSEKNILNRNDEVLNEIELSLRELKKILAKKNDPELESAIDNLFKIDIATLEGRLISLRSEIHKGAKSAGAISDDLRQDMSEIISQLKTWKDDFRQEHMRLEQYRQSLQLEKNALDEDLQAKQERLRAREASVLQKERELLQMSSQIPKAIEDEEKDRSEQEKFDQLERDKKLLADERAKLKTEFDKLMREVQERARDLKDREQRNDKIEKELEKDRKFLDLVFERLAKEHNKPFDWRREDWSDLEMFTSNLSLKKEIETLRQLLNEGKEREDALRSKLTKIPDLESDLASEKRKTQALDEQIEKLLAEVSTMKSVNDELRKKADIREKDYFLLQQEHQRLIRTLHEEKAAREQRDKEYRTLEQEHQRLLGTLQKEKAFREHREKERQQQLLDIQRLESELLAIKRSSQETINGLMERLNEEIAARKLAEQRAKDSDEGLKKIREYADKDNKKLLDEIEKLQKDASNKENALQKTIDSLRKDLEEHNRDLAIISQKLTEANLTIERLNQSLSTETQEKDKAKKQINDLIQEIERMKEKYESQLKATQLEIDQLKDKLLENERNQIPSEIHQDKLLELDESRKKMANLEKELSTAKDMINQLNEKIKVLQTTSSMGVQFRQPPPSPLVIPKSPTKRDKPTLLFDKDAPKLSLGGENWQNLFKEKVSAKLADPNVNVKLTASGSHKISTKQFSEICHSLQEDLQIIQNEQTLKPIPQEIMAEEKNVFENLAIEKLNAAEYRLIRETPLTHDKKEKIDLLHITHAEKKVEVVSTLLDPKDDVMYLMALTIKKSLEKLGRKTFNIANCEDNPISAFKLFLIGKSMGLIPVFKDPSEQKGATEKSLREEIGHLSLQVTVNVDGLQTTEEKTLEEIFDEVRKMSVKGDDPKSVNLIKNYISMLKVLEDQAQVFQPPKQY